MADPSRPRRARLGGLAPLALSVLAACTTGVPGNQGDPAAPLLIRGKVVDASGKPIGAAALQVEVFDIERSQVGQPIPLAFHQTYTANMDGTFAIHLSPTPDLAAKAGTNDGYVNFNLVVISPDQSVVYPFGFHRRLVGTAWVDDLPDVVLTPTGPRPASDPGVPAPLPAAT